MIRARMKDFIRKEDPNPEIISLEERRQYEELRAAGQREEAMTEEDFRIDVLGSPKSPWNQSAARVFTRFFIDENDFPPTLEVHTAIRNAVTAHIETIIRRYKQSHKSQPERLLYRSMDRRQSRKYKVSASYFLFSSPDSLPITSFSIDAVVLPMPSSPYEGRFPCSNTSVSTGCPATILSAKIALTIRFSTVSARLGGGQPAWSHGCGCSIPSTTSSGEKALVLTPERSPGFARQQTGKVLIPNSSPAFRPTHMTLSG